MDQQNEVFLSEHLTWSVICPLHAYCLTITNNLTLSPIDSLDGISIEAKRSMTNNITMNNQRPALV